MRPKMKFQSTKSFNPTKTAHSVKANHFCVDKISACAVHIQYVSFHIMRSLRIRDTCCNPDAAFSKSRKSKRVFVSERF